MLPLFTLTALVPVLPAAEPKSQPAAARRPVDDINRAIVYTVHETIRSDDQLALVARLNTDVLIRAWFKWHNATDYTRLARHVPQAHAMGAVFGGGITCSALYHGENRLTEAQVLDMATRGPDGQLVDAWQTPRCRHGTLSNPAYLEYLLSWCRQQIDAGADYLFMDEITAALHRDEGYDDYSLRDFHRWLVERFGLRGKPGDPQWDRLKIGSLEGFDYRAYLKQHGFTAEPVSSRNPFASLWWSWRRQRDDRAWKWLSDAIRAYAAQKGRRAWLSGNGLARYVDLQVLGVWGLWRVKAGRVDLADSQLEDWASLVAQGQALAGRRVPVVFFHDWGFGGFPWMEVAPAERKLWMRTRGAEIYAAGARFAFPIQGPLHNDASQDGTLDEVIRQTAFYQQHKALYLDAQFAGLEPLPTDQPLVSLALWRRDKPAGLMLHAINRWAIDGQLQRRNKVCVDLPVSAQPRAAWAVSPDWAGQRPVVTRLEQGKLRVVLPEWEAYTVVVLDYDSLPELAMAGPRIAPAHRWDRPERNQFVVEPSGMVRDVRDLADILHGRLHHQFRNPPTLLVNMPQGGRLRVHVRTVATKGARLEYRIDGQLRQAIDLPDRDRKNDSSAREYDQTFELPVPTGRHRLTLDNTGGDWLALDWLMFVGRIEAW
jgi:hypothetical protein